MSKYDQLDLSSVLGDTSPEEEKRRRLDQSMRVGMRTPSQQGATVNRLTRETGMSRQSVETDVAQAESLNKYKNLNIDQIMKDSPDTANFLSNPDNAAQAHEEIDSLTKMEQALKPDVPIIRAALLDSGVDMPQTPKRTWADAQRDRTEDTLNRILAPIKQGGTVVTDTFGRAPASGLLGGAGGQVEGYGRMIQDFEQGIAEIMPESVNDALTIDGFSTGGAVRKGGQVLKEVSEDINVPEDRQTVFTDIGSGVGQMGGQIALHLLNPAVSTAGMFAMGYDEQGSRQDKLGVNDPWAKLWGGTMTTALERVGMDQFLNRLPPKIKNELGREAAHLFAAGGIEFLEEWSEKLIHNVIEHLWYNANQEIVEMPGREEIGAGGGAAFLKWLPNLIKAGRTGRLTAQERQRMSRLRQGVGLSKLKDTNPEGLKEFIRRLGESTGTDVMYVDPEGAFELFQSGHFTEEDLQNPVIKSILEQVDSSRESGNPIQVPLDEYVTEIMAGDLDAVFQPHSKSDPDALTEAEEKQFDVVQQVNDVYKGMIEESKVFQEEKDVFDDIVGQLMGNSPGDQGVAETNAQYMIFQLRALAQRQGKTIKEVYQEQNPTFGKEIDPALQKQLKAVSQIDVMLNQIREGGGPTDSDIYGQSAMEFIREKGGIADDGGELAARDANKHGVYRKEGRSLDDMAEIMLEAGFISERSEQAVLDAIDKEMRGEGAYALGKENQELMTRRRDLQELDDLLNQAGIDMETLSNAQIAALLHSGNVDTASSDAILMQEELKKIGVEEVTEEEAADLIAHFEEQRRRHEQDKAKAESDRREGEEAEFLSSVPTGTKHHSEGTATERQIKAASTEVEAEIGTDATQTREVDEPLGPFTGYSVEATVQEGLDGEFLQVEIYGKEQVQMGLDDSPALTFVVRESGDLTIYGPDPQSQEYKKMRELGWAEPAKNSKGEVPYDRVHGGDWTRLKGVPLRQLHGLLGETHARSKAWTGDDWVGLYWTRATGAGGGVTRSRSVFFQSGNNPTLNQLLRDSRPQVASQQNFGDTQVQEQVMLEDEGTVYTASVSAQNEFDGLMKRRETLEQVRKCMNA